MKQIIAWFQWKFGRKEKQHCKNCFYNVILPSNRWDRITRTFSETDRVCRNPTTTVRFMRYGAEYFRSLYKSSNSFGWNCPHWIRRSPNQPEVK
jgi:hypothetical protein